MKPNFPISLNDPDGSLEARLDEYWGWFTVAMFLLFPLDMLTTIGAVVKYGVHQEINPIVSVLLGLGIVPFIVANLLALAVAVYVFSNLLKHIENTVSPHRIYLENLVAIWLTTLIGLGLFVFANNLSVIVLGESLL